MKTLTFFLLFTLTVNFSSNQVRCTKPVESAIDSVCCSWQCDTSGVWQSWNKLKRIHFYCNFCLESKDIHLFDMFNVCKHKHYLWGTPMIHWTNYWMWFHQMTLIRIQTIWNVTATADIRNWVRAGINFKLNKTVVGNILQSFNLNYLIMS